MRSITIVITEVVVEDVLMILNYNSYGNDDSHGTDLKLWNKLRNEKLESLELEKDKLNDNFIYVTIAYRKPLKYRGYIKCFLIFLKFFSGKIFHENFPRKISTKIFLQIFIGKSYGLFLVVGCGLFSIVGYLAMILCCRLFSSVMWVAWL